MANDYSIWVLEYAHAPRQPAEAVYSGYAHQGDEVFMPFSFVLVRGCGRTMLIDCGIDFTSTEKTRMAHGFNVTHWHGPVEVLAGAGLAPGDIDVIFVTHAHWDHMGSLRLFPNAEVVIQRAERQGWNDLLGKSAQYRCLLGAVDPDDIHALDHLNAQGRLVELDGEAADYFPGIHIWVDRAGHSHACQLVLIESDADGLEDNYIAIGDVAYSADNLTGVPEYPYFIPNTKWAIGGAYSTLQTYERILAYVDGDLGRVIIEHDRATWTRHPTVQLDNGLHITQIRRACNESLLPDFDAPARLGDRSPQPSTTFQEQP